MLSKIARLSGATLVSMAFAHTAAAQDANVSTGAASAKLGGEFRAELNYDDHGFEKVDGGPTPDATTTIQLQRVALKLHGNINSNTEYGFRFNLLNPVGGPVDYGYGTHWFSKTVGFSIGRMKVLQGGWDTWLGDYTAHAGGVYFDNLAFSEFEDMIALNLKVAGDVRLQLLNDKVVGTDADAQWNKTAHPTWVVGWMGEFGPIKPLVNIGSYDNNKSRWIDVGVATTMAGLNASLDIYSKNQVDKGTDTAGKTKEFANEGMGLTLNLAYEIKGTATPFLYFSSWDNKQAEDSATGRKDSKVNTTNADGSFEWDDNGQTIAVGSNFHMMGKGWTPYAAIVSQSGKFMEGTEEKTKSNMWVKLGVLGEI